MKKCIAMILALLLLPLCALADGETPVLPIPDGLGDRPITELSLSEDGNSLFAEYGGANEEDLEQYLTLCTMNGIYPKDFAAQVGKDGALYLLFVPGTAYVAFAEISPEDDALVIMSSTGSGLLLAGEEELEPVYTFLSQDVRLPDGASGYVFPQFYAAVERMPDWQNQTEGTEGVFDGKLLWEEDYTGITNDKLLNYTRHMILFGFTVRADDAWTAEDGTVTLCRLHYTNEEAEVIVDYDPMTNAANVYYKPGVQYYLLDTRQLTEATAAD